LAACTDGDGVCAWLATPPLPHLENDRVWLLDFAPFAMLQLADNPPMMFSAVTRGESLADADWGHAWAIGYTKPRQEKCAARDLQEAGVSYFLPMRLRETLSGGRRRRNLYPLFASYIFLPDDEPSRLTALRTHRVVGFVPVKPPEQPQLQKELAQLARALEECPDTVDLYPRLTPGAPVVVTAGAMKGVEGVVIDADRKKKVLLAVTALGVGITVEIHADLLASR
jgi:transcription antitermination factor NusG